ncbi:MAG: hypothetical protein PUK59_02775 [Actinomycetaceae bacterium]|nr:hypothetical protein [Actinomycetaceae bacterium]MDY5855375.1 hypothetical protein [Arcanobacterium sp.]
MAKLESRMRRDTAPLRHFCAAAGALQRENFTSWGSTYAGGAQQAEHLMLLIRYGI